MARILFTVCGVGRGHATRSSVLIGELMKNHEVFVVSYGDAVDVLKGKFRVEPISWFKMLYAKNSYRGISTILYNIPRIPFVFAGNLLKLRKIVGDFRPDIVISDFDVNGIYIAKLSGLPVITISNMHMMDYEKPRLSTSEKIGFLLTQESMLKSFVGTDHFIIMHLIKPKQGKKGVDFFYPIVRQSVTSATPDDKGYFLVYSSAAQLPALLPVLEKFPEKKFLVVGMEGKKTLNTEFRVSLDETEFAEKLASCTAFLSHGGLSSMTEAIVLGKPVYTFTSKKFYERYYNGEIAQKLGLGFTEETPSFEGLSEFFSKIQEYKKSISKLKLTPENTRILEKIGEIISDRAKKGK